MTTQDPVLRFTEADVEGPPELEIDRAARVLHGRCA
jgi:hypothetical protein